MPPFDDDFYTKYPAFTGLANDFSDPVDDSESDESIARNVRREVDIKRRVQLIAEILVDAERLAENLSSDWPPLSKYVNRGFANEGAARLWLETMIKAWREEKSRLS